MPLNEPVTFTTGVLNQAGVDVLKYDLTWYTVQLVVKNGYVTNRKGDVMDFELTNRPYVALAIERATIQPINTSPLVQWLDTNDKRDSFRLVSRLAYQSFGMLSDDGVTIYHVFKYNGDKTRLPDRVQTVNGVEMIFNGVINKVKAPAEMARFEQALLKITTAPRWLYLLVNEYLNACFVDKKWVKLSTESETFTDLLNGVHPESRAGIVERVTDYVIKLGVNSTAESQYTLIVSMLEPFIGVPLDDREKAFIERFLSSRLR